VGEWVLSVWQATRGYIRRIEISDNAEEESGLTLIWLQ
jgi:hypothetical protein